MRKFLIAIMFVLSGVHAHAAQMVNVEYIHKLIKQRWDITIPYSPKLSTPKVAANMKYLLSLVDMTNKRINGTPTTDYGNGEFATMVAADTIAANRAITKLIKLKPKFTITTTPDTTEFEFRMSARGRFMVDWGDNTATEIVRDDTELSPYAHTYRKPGEYKIKITGLATGYAKGNPATSYADSSAISFSKNNYIARISGSLSAIFPTIGDGENGEKQPRFQASFSNCTNLGGAIPPELFTGLHGKATVRMFDSLFNNCSKLSGPIPAGLFARVSNAQSAFSSTFAGCANLTGEIPAGLFGDIDGGYSDGMFYKTFYGCGKLSGSIPSGLFGNLYGKPKIHMFIGTFFGCSGLTGSIPAGLFGNLSGAPHVNIFAEVFRLCTGLTGEIPADLFGSISGEPAGGMFLNAFAGCRGLTGPSARINGVSLYEIWPDIVGTESNKCYSGATGLSDYPDIPSMWR